MNIQEAIKSGKPFKRERWVVGGWIYNNDGVFEYLTGGVDEPANEFFVEDILADDWEVKE